MLKIFAVFILFALFLTSCSGGLKPISSAAVIGSAAPNVAATAAAEDIISEEKAALQANLYSNNFDKIEVYGIDEERIKSIIAGINPKYFEELKLLQMIHSNRQATGSDVNGMYYPDSKQITLWLFDESDGYIRYLLLHELKHHHCNPDITHSNCFLNTPIDEEYGFIK